MPNSTSSPPEQAARSTVEDPYFLTGHRDADRLIKQKHALYGNFSQAEKKNRTFKEKLFAKAVDIALEPDVEQNIDASRHYYPPTPAKRNGTLPLILAGLLGAAAVGFGPAIKDRLFPPSSSEKPAQQKPVDKETHVDHRTEYEKKSGTIRFWVDGEEVPKAQHTPDPPSSSSPPPITPP